MTRALLLAVDGGGTRTQALVADAEGVVLGRGLGPGSNLHNMEFERSCRALTTAIDGALMAALGLGADGAGRWRDVPIAAACFGLSGVDVPEDAEQVSAWVREQAIAPRFSVVNDCELVLAAGTPDGWGVAVVSGTGSVCLARAPGVRADDERVHRHAARRRLGARGRCSARDGERDERKRNREARAWPSRGGCVRAMHGCLSRSCSDT